jgi:hypothetical protein
MSPRLFLLVTLLVPSGCATTITPPRNVADPTPIYLIDYGRHSSIMFRVANDEVREYCFGDYDWAAMNRNAPPDAIRALFNSAGSTLGRKPAEFGGDADQIKSAIGADDVFRLTVSREKADALLHRLDSIFDSRLNTLTFNASWGMWFVRTPDRYSALHNCNHVTNRWLNSMGVRTRGSTAFARFKIAE